MVWEVLDGAKLSMKTDLEDPKPSTTRRPDLDPALNRQSVNSYLGNNWKNLNMDQVVDVLRNNCVWHNNGGYTKKLSLFLRRTY